MQLKRKAAIVLLTAIVALCVLYAGVWSVVRTHWFRSWLETRAHRAGIELTLGKIRLGFPFELVVYSIHATSAGSFDLSSEEIRASLNPFTLALGELSELELVEPRVRLPLPSSSSGSETTAPIGLLVGSLVIHDGRVELETGHNELLTIPHINLTGHELNLGGQTGAMDTTAFLPLLDADLRLHLKALPSGIKAEFEVTQQAAIPADAASKAPDTVTSRGEISLDLGRAPGINLNGEIHFDRFAWRSVTYTGKIDLAAGADEKRNAVAIDLTAEIADVAGSAFLDNPDAVLPLSISTKGEFTTRDEKLVLSVIRIASPLTDLTGRATLSFHEEPALTQAVLEVPTVALSRLQRILPVPKTPALEAELSGRVTLTGKLNPWSFSGTVEAKGIKTDAAGVKIGEIEGSTSFAVQPDHFQASAVHLAARELAWKPPGYGLDAGLASLVLQGSVEHDAGKKPSFQGKLEFGGGRFTTADGLAAAENVQGTASLELQLQGNNAVRTELRLQLATMELLWHRFFADFKPKRPKLVLAATYDATAGTLVVQEGRFELEQIGAVELDGRLAIGEKSPTFDVHLRTAGLRLSTFYDFFIRDTFKTSQPAVAALELAGTLRMNLASRGRLDQFALEGTTQLQGMELGRPTDWRIGPVDLTLPFKVQYPESTGVRAAEPAPRAAMAVRGIDLGSAKIPAFTVFLSLWDNAFTLVKPLQIPIYGGSLTVERLAWHDILASPRKFSFSGRIDDISLDNITKDLGWYEFDGSLSGVIPQVDWAEDTLRTDGELEVSVFGGQIKLDELEVRSLAGFLPKIKANVEIRDINLEQATKAFEFGTISGILSGKVDGLVISNGQPSQFRADVHTVSTPGVSQWISVEALNKIVVLGSGTEGSAPYGMLAGLFDYYRYREIGFKAQLRNDLLILQGVKSQDGKEFLVEGSLIPPTVNVVSHRQRISFKELVSRLERIAESGPAQ